MIKFFENILNYLIMILNKLNMFSLIFNPSIKLQYKFSLTKEELEKILENQRNEEFVVDKKIIISELNEEKKIRYKKVLKYYSTIHYWKSLYNKNFDENEIILFNGIFNNFWECSLIRIATNDYIKDKSLRLIFTTTAKSLIDGIYDWNFNYENDKIILYHKKSGCLNYRTTFIGKFLIDRNKIIESNKKFIENELNNIKEYINGTNNFTDNFMSTRYNLINDIQL